MADYTIIVTEEQAVSGYLSVAQESAQKAADAQAVCEEIQENLENDYVPYNGATNDVDLGAHQIKTAALDLNTDADPISVGARQLQYSPTEGTIEVGLDDGGVLQVGKEIFDYYRNLESVNLVAGDIVSIVETPGGNKGIMLTDATDSVSAKNVCGMITVPVVAPNAYGRVTKSGEVHDLVTSGLLEGTKIYVDEANPGKWSIEEPTTGNYIVEIGTVVVSQNGNGIIDVRPVCFPKLTDLSGVNGIESKPNRPIVRTEAGIIDAVDDLEVNSISLTDGSDESLLTGTGAEMPISELKAGIYQLFNPSDNATVVLEINAAGQVLISGDIIHQGSSYETHAENINTPQATIELRDGAVSGLNIGEYAGFIVKLYDGVNDGQIVIDKDGVLRIGDVGSLQPVATREESPVDQSPAFWDSVAMRFKTLAGTTTKTTPVDADAITIKDSADSNKPKWLSWANIKATLKTYFDSLYVALTGNQTIAGIKTFSSSPVVPTPSAGTDAANKDYVTSTVIGAMPSAMAIYDPELGYHTRVYADSGLIRDYSALNKLFIDFLTLRQWEAFAWSGIAGYKTRTSGSNQYISKAYDTSANNRDLTQTTEASQPDYAGFIAPNEKGKIKSITDDKSLSHTAITLNSTGTSGWSVTTVLRPYFQKIGTSSNTGTYTAGGVNFYVTNDGRIQMYSSATGTLYLDTATFDARKHNRLVITWGADSSSIYVYVNGRRYTVSGTYTNINSNVTALLYSGSDDTFAGTIMDHRIHTKKLSDVEAQQLHDYLMRQYPDVDGNEIRNQYIATSNHEVVCCSDGCMITNVTGTDAASNPEVLTNYAFLTDLTGWTNGAGVTWVSAGVIAWSGGTGSFVQSTLDINRTYKVVLTVARTSGTLVVYTGSGASYSITASGTYTFWIKCLGSTSFNIYSGAFVGQVSGLSCKAAGWSDYQTIYDDVYARTTGTTENKVNEARKAAAMWCYYDNNATYGALYGKLFNGYAADHLNMFPQENIRLMTTADWQQLSTQHGGDSVSGMRLKARWGGFDNQYASNTTGMTVIPGGRRTDTGVFDNLGYLAAFWTADSDRVLFLSDSTATAFYTSYNKGYGHSIRMMRNEPVGNDIETADTGFFTTDIASTPKSIAIPFGFTCESVRIFSANALTSIECKLYDYSGALLATLFTGKSMSAGQSMVFNSLADHAALLQDGTVRIAATGNGGVRGMRIQPIFEKRIKSVV